LIKVWKFDAAGKKFDLMSTLEGHTRGVTCLYLHGTFSYLLLVYDSSYSPSRVASGCSTDHLVLNFESYRSGYCLLEHLTSSVCDILIIILLQSSISLSVLVFLSDRITNAVVWLERQEYSGLGARHWRLYRHIKRHSQWRPYGSCHLFRAHGTCRCCRSQRRILCCLWWG
jgi:hypothetical protein